MVVVTVLGTSERVKVTIVWAGGTATAGEVIRPVQRLEQRSYYSQLTDRIRELAGQGIGASGIADRLQAEGSGLRRAANGSPQARSHRPRPHAPPRLPRTAPHHPARRPARTSGGASTWPPSWT